MPEPESTRRHKWLRWVGLQEPETPAVDPDAWTPVAHGLQVDDTENGTSEAASRVTAALTAAGIESHQRPYLLQDDISMGRVGLRLLGPGPPAVDRIRLAVLVQNRNLPRAGEVVAGLPEANEPDPPTHAVQPPASPEDPPGDTD